MASKPDWRGRGKGVGAVKPAPFPFPTPPNQTASLRPGYLRTERGNRAKNLAQPQRRKPNQLMKREYAATVCSLGNTLVADG